MASKASAGCGATDSSSPTLSEATHVSARLCAHRVSHSFIHISTPKGAIRIAVYCSAVHGARIGYHYRRA